ncbi:MAG TPA: hypothetical protein VG347_20085, partial [Verrucomicrobiae bacterium]|nr:hypothetical protein [Verrucomicrobiae bacterium]
MNLPFSQKLLTAVACVFLATQLFAADTTNEWATPGVTREEVANNYLHIQEQIHESQLAIQKDQQAALDAAKNNADALAARLQSLEDTV